MFANSFVAEEFFLVFDVGKQENIRDVFEGGKTETFEDTSEDFQIHISLFTEKPKFLYRTILSVIGK